MKKIALSLVLLSLCLVQLFSTTNDPTVMTINGKRIPLSEFSYIYNKNNSSNVIEKKTLDEYVDMFVDFKLKVEEAISLGLDTLPTFKKELNTYRMQLGEQYLTDHDKQTALLKEAYERTQNEVEAYHILVRIPQEATAADTLAAYQKAMKIYKRANSNEDFETLAREISDDPRVQEYGGYVGWISAMRTPYQFETTAYNTPVGTIAKPIRTFIGYHIIKVTGKRPSVGQVKVAHIFLLDDKNNPTQNEKNKQRIDSIYNAVKNGADFGKLATQLSQDPGSAMKKGELPWFGSGQMIPLFEKTAFAMTQPNEISKPIHTQVGWHIIKLIEKKPVESFEELTEALNSQMMQGERAELIKQAFANRLKKEYHLTENKEALNDFYRLADTYLPADTTFIDKAQKMHKVMFSYDGGTFTQDKFVTYIKNKLQTYRGEVRNTFIRHLYSDYLYEQLLAYEQTQLSRKYPDYRNLLNEYHDGILLFDVMNKNVWEKATTDTKGLEQIFEKNKSKYKWKTPHYKGLIIYCKDRPTLKTAKYYIKHASKDSLPNYLQKRLNDSIQYVKIEKGIWKKGEKPIVDANIYKQGKYTPTEEYPYYLLEGKNLKTNPENYTDIKGKVISDYQLYLEKKWMNELRKKYTVVIHKKVLEMVKQ